MGAENMNKKNEAGYTLVEVIGVLGIIGMIAASASMLASSVMDRYRKNRVQDEIQTLQKVISQRYVADGNFNKVKEDTLVDEALVPKYMISNNQVIQPYGNVEVIAGELTYGVMFDGLPMAVCVALGGMNWVYSDSSDLVSITINNDKFIWPINIKQNDEKALPLSTTQLSKSCKKEDNEITWEFQ